MVQRNLSGNMAAYEAKGSVRLKLIHRPDEGLEIVSVWISLNYLL